MKKTLLALAAVAATGGALAADENSVTMYGVADAYVGRTSTYSYDGFDLTAYGAKSNMQGMFRATKNNQMVVNSGGLSGSRVGLRVNENLGNGNTGFVVLEAGGRIDTGTSVSARKAIVGVKSDFGTVSFGRQNSSYDDAFARVSAQGDSSFDAAKGGPLSIGGMTAIASFRRYINDTYVAPAANITNPTARAQYFAAAAAAAENDPQYRYWRGAAIAATNSISNGSTISGSTGAWVGYKARFDNSIRYETPNFDGFSGSVTLGLGENKGQNANGAVKATKDVAFNVKYANGPMMLTFAHQLEEVQPPTDRPYYVNIVPVNSLVKLQNTLIGGSYDFGAAKLHAGFNVAKYNIEGVKTQKELLLGVSAPMGPVTLIAQYARSQGDSLENSQSFGVEAHYALSKRSTAYAALNTTKMPAYKNSTIGAGVRHIF